MHIVKGHDYYDGAGMGVDKSIVFVRTPRDLDPGPFALPPDRDGRQRTRALVFFHTIIAGQVFPGLEERWWRADTAPARELAPDGADHLERRLHYDIDAARAAFERYDRDLTASVPRGCAQWSRRMARADLRRHFEERRDAEWTDHLIDNHVVTGLVSRLAPGTRFDARATVILRADIDTLKELDAPRLMPPAQAHMAIANFISGVLPQSRPMVELSDADRLRKAGFDAKASFRKPARAGKKR